MSIASFFQLVNTYLTLNFKRSQSWIKTEPPKFYYFDFNKIKTTNIEVKIEN